LFNTLLSGPSKCFKYFSSNVQSFNSIDGKFEKDRVVKTAGAPNQKEFTYFFLGGARMVNVSVARLALITVRFLFIPYYFDLYNNLHINI
jgi:hypothetical protein